MGGWRGLLARRDGRRALGWLSLRWPARRLLAVGRRGLAVAGWRGMAGAAWRGRWSPGELGHGLLVEFGRQVADALRSDQRGLRRGGGAMKAVCSAYLYALDPPI